MFRTTKLMISDTLALAYSRDHDVRVHVLSREDFAFESFDCGASTCRYPEKQEAESQYWDRQE